MKLFFLLSFFITFVMSTVDNVVSARDDVGVGADWNTAGAEMASKEYPWPNWPKECEVDSDCKYPGDVCKDHWVCMPITIITKLGKSESARDVAAQDICRLDSDCPSDGSCINFSCIVADTSAFRFIDRRSPQGVNCHNSVDCDGGHCYHGICVAEPPRLESELESRSPQTLICHNSADCDGGYCYRGICVASPPMDRDPKQPGRPPKE
ncbi:hypothetical protein BJX68DRAFT_87719 [Aspergillus pseudodeflectus]|uniref:Uncharacterized protein n=1 Tax=Aspergillus pseudodeflectus TaxID=176178 RepID=A0ABR4L7J4_9EURO